MERSDKFEDAPSVRLTLDGRLYEEIPVLEGDETLAGLISGKYGSSASPYLWESEYSRTYLVLAASEQTALDWLADHGILDGMKVPPAEEKTQLEKHGRVLDAVRLGNAGEPFVLDLCRLRNANLSDLTHLLTPLTFGRNGWIHLWDSGPDSLPYRDVVLKLGDGFVVEEAWSPQGVGHASQEYLQELANRHLWTLVHEHC